MKLKRAFLLTILFALGLTAIAQPRQDFTKSADSDPAAKAVLDKVKTKYEAYQTLEAEFTLTIEIPEQPKETQAGKLIQKGDQYRLDLQDQAVISDGQSVWLYLKKNQEVQINDAEPEDGESLSPKDLLRIYETEDFVYALTNEFVEDGRTVQQIEFKPLSDDSEYAKIRLTVDKSNSTVKRIETFAKDGARYTLEMDKFTPNKAYPASTFAWSKSECPDCYVEDLRF